MPFDAQPKDVHGKLYGRASELRILGEAFQRVQRPDEPALLAFVGGHSGAGKSALILRAFEKRKDLCLYGSGKYSRRRDPKPFAAICAALSAICLGMSRSTRLHHYKEILSRDLDPEALISIVTLVPALSKIVQIEKTTEIKRKLSATSSEESLRRLKLNLRLFIRTIASVEAPVVLVLDDIQWIDTLSLSVLQSVLVSDHELTNVLFVGAFRDNEVDEKHGIFPWLRQLCEESAVGITVGGLSVENVEALIADVLKAEDVRELAELMYSRTAGNAFHVLQLLDFLQNENLLEYTYNTSMSLEWTWDIEQLRAQTKLSEEILDMVGKKLIRLHPDVQRCLTFCSLLGYRFDESTLILIHRARAQGTKEQNLTVEACLTIAIQECVLERLEDGWVKFSHERIHQAALQLGGGGNACAMIHLQIGTTLWKEFRQHRDMLLKHNADNRRLFVCTDQLNLGRHLIRDRCSRVELAGLNNEAAKSAAAVSAFVPAIDYLQIGVSLLEADYRWEDHYKLSLNLFTSLAVMFFSTGQLAACEIAIQEVISHARSIDHSIRVYVVWMQCLAAQTKYRKQINTALDVLERLGETINSNPGWFQTRRVLEKTKRQIQLHSDEDILRLPLMKDQHKIAAIQVLSEIILTVDTLGMHNLTSTLICRITALTFQYGLAPYSALGFAMVAQLNVSKKHDIDSGFRFAQLAVSLAERFNDPQLSSRVYLHSGIVLHWRQPLSMTVDYWIDAHKEGMHNGDISTAVHCITRYGIAYFYSGLPIGPFVSDIGNFCTLMFKYGQTMFLLSNVPLYQCVLNLTGQTDDILDMASGTACDYRTRLGWTCRTGEQAGWSHQMQIAFYCEKFDLATSLYEKLEPVYAGADRGLPLYHARVFFFALICIHNAKNGGRRKYRAEARKHLNVLRGWVMENRAINIVHKLMILQAEMMTLDKKKSDSEILAAFDKAIVAAAKVGFLQDAALAAHLGSRAAANEETCQEYFRRARDMYLSWGAVGVIDHLEEATPHYQETSDSASFGASGTRFRGRSRFDNSLERRHHSLDIGERDTRSSISGSLSAHFPAIHDFDGYDGYDDYDDYDEYDESD